jgi:hypothetical protein
MWNHVSSSKLLRRTSRTTRQELSSLGLRAAPPRQGPRQAGHRHRGSDAAGVHESGTRSGRSSRQFYNQKVYYENNLLLKKLTAIDRGKGSLNKDRLMGANFAYNGRNKCFRVGDKNSLHNGWLKAKAADRRAARTTT